MGNAKLDEHSKRKHKILREYFHEYLITRCQLPYQERFRLAIIDAFAGAGKYSDGSYGSPLIFIDELKKTLIEINLSRTINGSKPIEIECLLVFNDIDREAVLLLKENAAALIADIKENCLQLHINVLYLNSSFGQIYQDLKTMLHRGRYRNVMFNLDQYSYADVDFTKIKDIFLTWKSAEAFLTFPIETILAFISTEKQKNSTLTQDEKLLQEIYSIIKDSAPLNKKAWLGLSERLIFDRICECAAYVSPFSIHNPNGWRYWLIHLANNYRARQVYNDILHQNNTFQAHFGRSGLRMLHYDPAHEGSLYLFDQPSRETAKHDLYDDIPRFIVDHGDAINVFDFYSNVYNETPVHSDDIHEMMLENPDLEVLTPAGNPRKSVNAITPSDTIRVKSQRSFFPVFRKMPSE